MNSENFFFTTIFVLLLISSISFASVLEVRVLPVIKGLTYFTNNTFINDTNAIKSEVFWENIGSIECDCLYRIDYYYGTMKNIKKKEINNMTYIDFLCQENQMKLIHSSFSGEKISPGGRKSIFNYFIPLINSTDNYIEMTVQPRIFMCGEIIYLKPYEINMSLVNITLNNDIGLEILDAGNDKNNIIYNLKSSQKNTAIVIIPYKKPFWYNVPGTYFKFKKNKEGTVRIPFIADESKTNQRNISFVFASSDLKKIYAIHEMTIKPLQDKKITFFAVIIIAILFLVAFKYIRNIFVNQKREIKQKQKAKKPNKKKQTKKLSIKSIKLF